MDTLDGLIDFIRQKELVGEADNFHSTELIEQYKAILKDK
jgi:hypothetical protein